jgi:hypothetical protein
VDERRASPLTFDILTDSLLTGIPNSAAEVSIAPKCPFFPKRLFQRFAHAFAITERSILVFIDGQWPAVKFEVRFSPNSEYGLDPLQALQKRNLNELQFLQTTASPHRHRKPATSCDTYKRK